MSPAVDLVSRFVAMDSPILSASVTPTVVFGPGGAGAHAAIEWVALADVERCARV